MWNYKDWLYEQLVRIAKDEGIDNSVRFHVFEEQDFIKKKQIINPNEIFVVIKNLSSNIMFNAKVQPKQMTILSEGNGLQIANFVFRKFVSLNNWTTTIDGERYIKHQYSDPVVLQNFQAVSKEYRSILYMSATFYIMEDVVDVDEIKVNGESITPVSFNISYSLSQDTQPFPDSFLVKSVGQYGVFSCTIQIPPKKYAFLVNKILKIVNGTLTGDTIFNVSFTLKNSSEVFDYDLRLSSFSMATAPNTIPGITIGLVM